MRAKESRLARTPLGETLGWRLVVLFAMAACCVPAGWGATYYVDQGHPSASDSNSGSENAPFSTITHAANVVRAGDTVIVKPGVYGGRIGFSSVNSGSANNKVTFRAEPARSAKMDGFDTTSCNYVRIEGFEITKLVSGWNGAGVRTNSDHVEVVNNYIHDVASAGVGTTGDDDDYEYVGYNLIERCQYGFDISGRGHVIEHNEVTRLKQHVSTNDVDYARFFGFDHVWRYNWFHDTAQADIGTAHLDGFQTWSLDNSSFTQNMTITGNVVQGVHQGIMMESNNAGNVRDIYVSNNVFDGTQNWGISMKIGCLNIVVYNNIFTNCQTHTVGVRNGSSAIIKNNIFYRDERSYFADAATLESSNNIVYLINRSFTPQPNDIHEDPQFVNWNNFNGADGVPFTADDGYRLLPTSPGINGGTTVPLSEDQVGTPRPQGAAFDIGPIEMVEGGSPAVTVSIGAPTPQLTKNSSVNFVVSYGNADTITLNAGDVTLNTTGTASGSVSVSGSGSSSRTVTLANVSGDGTLRISVAANTASNTDNNAPAAGPSAAATVDNTSPVITITGNNPLTWPHGSTYVDPGATATDAVSGDLSGNIDVQANVNSSVVGTYSVSYTVADAVGNSAAATRTVHVTDQSPPVLTLLGNNPLTMVQDDPYNEPGATALDAVDGDVSSAIAISGTVNNATPGTYSLAYSVADAAGNVANATRTVEVIERDVTPPVITILGANPATVGQNNTYSDAGAAAFDNVDGDLTSAIAVENNVNTSVIGDYSVVYRVSDAEGNEAVATRNVTVTEANDPPVLSPVGPQNVDEDQTLIFTVSATDPQGNAPALMANGLPNGAVFTDQGNGSGAFQWTPAFNQGKKQPYTIEFVADDGELTDVEPVSVTVNNVNRKPKVNKPGGPKKGREAELTTLAVSATDDDGDPLQLTADMSGLPSGNDAAFTDNGDGTAELNWTPQEGDAGTYQITVTATDLGEPSLSDSANFDLEIDFSIGSPHTFHVAAGADPNAADGSFDNPYPTIGDAMNAVEAGRGDVVQVFEGSYFEDVELKAATSLIGVNGAYHTLVLGSADHLTDILHMADGSAVRGFTFAGKTHASAVEVNVGAHATITNCILANSAAGLHLRNNSQASAVNLTIHGNDNEGIIADQNSKLTELADCIVADNLVGIASDSDAVVAAHYNAWFNNGTDYQGPAPFAEYTAQPSFVDAASLNFHLTANSPYRDAGDQNADRNDRDGTRNDLGADGGPQGRVDTMAPWAHIVASASQGVAPITVSFDGSNSSDEWGIAGYAWDFDAMDGITVDATGSAVNHTFTQNGLYKVTLTVTDNNGHTAKAMANIELGTDLPVVTAMADPSAGPSPLTVNLTGTATDPDGGPVTLQWDFDGDNVTDSTDANTSVVFDTAPGSHEITLTGTDDENLKAQASTTVTVTAGPVVTNEIVQPDSETVLYVADTTSPLAGMQVTLPTGSVSEPTLIAVSESTDVPPLPDDVTPLAVGSIDPAGFLLSMAATIEWPMPVSKSLSAEDYDVFVYDGQAGKWTDNPISYVSVLNGTTMSFMTTQLGTFAVAEKSETLPTIEFTETTRSVPENANEVALTVTVSPAVKAGKTVTVRFLTANVSAQSGADYTSTTGTLTFSASKSTHTIVVPILDDETSEANESFRIVLTDAQGAVIGENNVVSITIVDNDAGSSVNGPAPAGCSAGTIGTGSTNPPADFLLLALLVSIAAFGSRLVRRPAESNYNGPVALG